jgi:AcrR family transcriptional regulator
MADKNYHHGDLRTGLVLGARAILERDGLAALSLRACAREVGVSHAAPLHHFKSLAELLAAVAASGFVDFVAALDVGSRHVVDPLDRLMEMGISYVRFAAENPALYRVMFGSETPHVASNVLGEAMRAAWDQLYEAVCMAGGSQHGLANASLVWAFAHGHAMLVAAQCMPPLIDSDDVYRASLQMIANGMRMQKT